MRLSVLGPYLAATTAAIVLEASATCECGYTLGGNTLFTDLFETDFLHLYSLPTSIDSSANDAVGWIPQAYNVSPSAARGPFGKSAEVGNIVLNPLNSTNTWGGQDGIHGGPPGLQLWVRGQTNLSDYLATADMSERGKMVRISEINSLRRDIKYGSFRIGMQMSSVSGTCAAFFWYRNNTQEIDMEYLSHQSSVRNVSANVNLVIQSPLSALYNFNAATTSTFSLHPLNFLPGEDYHDYRFDWTPASIAFFVDGVFLQDFESYPDAEGTLMLNHWSNGDPNWSKGPPVIDTAVTVSYMKAYFNTSARARNVQWLAACADKWQGRTCEIHQFPAKGISPLGTNGNVTGRTDFFMYAGEEAVVNQTVYPAATAVPGEGGRVTALQTYCMIVFVIVGLMLV